MKAYEFRTTIAPGGKLELPDELIHLLPDNQEVRVIIFVNEPADSDAEVAWSRLAAEQLFRGYAEADAIYDQVR